MNFGRTTVENPVFMINGHKIEHVDNFVHLGIPVGMIFFISKYNKFEWSFNSPLYSMGCHKRGLNPILIGNIL